MGKQAYIPKKGVSGGLGSNPVQNLVALASTKSHRYSTADGVLP